MTRTAYEQKVDAEYVRLAAERDARISSYSNINVAMEDTTLVIRIETDERKISVKPSRSSGKTMVIATTGGAMVVDGYNLNLTLYRPRQGGE
jgi:hypothetical protein